MAKYRKKPVVIEAIQWDGTEKSALDISEMLEMLARGFKITVHTETYCDFSIATLEGMMRVSEGDFVIQGVRGECYPCKPDIFEMTYEKVEE